jgi:hypothetical protein
MTVARNGTCKHLEMTSDVRFIVKDSICPGETLKLMFVTS